MWLYSIILAVAALGSVFTLLCAIVGALGRLADWLDISGEDMGILCIYALMVVLLISGVTVEVHRYLTPK